MVAFVLGTLGLCCVGRGARLAIQLAEQASFWVALSAGLALSFAAYVFSTHVAAALLPAIILSSSAGFFVVVAAILRREYALSAETADAAQVEDIVRLARAHQRSLRLRGRSFCRRC